MLDLKSFNSIAVAVDTLRVEFVSCCWQWTLWPANFKQVWHSKDDDKAHNQTLKWSRENVRPCQETLIKKSCIRYENIWPTVVLVIGNPTKSGVPSHGNECEL